MVSNERSMGTLKQIKLFSNNIMKNNRLSSSLSAWDVEKKCIINYSRFQLLLITNVSRGSRSKNKIGDIQYIQFLELGHGY